ncbi:MAG: hypothetical protein AAGC55_25230, partial [Myxococcota bacterium]
PLGDRFQLTRRADPASLEQLTIERAPTAPAMPTSEQYFQRGIDLLRELGNDLALAQALESYGRYKLDSAGREPARPILGESLAIYRRLGLPVGERVSALLEHG